MRNYDRFREYPCNYDRGHAVVVSAFPDNGWMQVIDTFEHRIVDTLQPGRAILHMEFTPKGEAVWISARDDNKVVVYGTAKRDKLAELPAASPSGVFFTSRAFRTGF